MLFETMFSDERKNGFKILFSYTLHLLMCIAMCYKSKDIWRDSKDTLSI